MTGAMYASISGLKAHMDKLSVIGNNIANVNTYGYKSGRASFQDALYTTRTSGSNGTTTTGGRNPSQIGYGAEIRSVDLNMTTGNYTPTGYPMDCMINGDGFFLVGDKDVADRIDGSKPNSLKDLTLTRVGDIDFKGDGYLSDSQGNVVYGFMCVGEDAEGNPIISDQLVPIRLPRQDSKGGLHFPKEGADGQGGRLQDQEVVEVVGGGNEETVVVKPDSVSIDPSTGKITAVTEDDQSFTVGYIAIGKVDNPAGVTHTSGPYYKAGEGAGTLSVSLIGGAANDLIDDDNFTGFVNGSLVEKAEDRPTGMGIGDGGKTELLTNGLESSKTDLATEISEMITTQRGYQANTRIITVTDAMLEELVNMKR